MELKKRLRYFIILVILVTNIGCDQVSKIIVRENINYNEQISVIKNFMILTKVENTGAFLSLGNNLPKSISIILLIILPLLVMAYAIYYMITGKALSKFMVAGLAFVISGGIGNIFDRIVYGSVTDFMHFNFYIFQTGILNMADLSVTIGFLMILYDLYVGRKKNIDYTAA